MTRNLSTFLASAAGFIAGALGSLPWLAGSFIVVQPDLARLLLIAAPAGGAVAALAALVLRQGHPAVRIATGLLGLLAVASSPAFTRILADQAPAEPRAAGVVDSTTAAPAADRLRVLQLNAWHGYPDPGDRLVVQESPSDRLVRAGRLATEVSRLQPRRRRPAGGLVHGGRRLSRRPPGQGTPASTPSTPAPTARCDGWASKRVRRSSAASPSMTRRSGGLRRTGTLSNAASR